MDNNEKLEFLINTFRREILNLEPSMEVGAIEMRERLENALLRIGVEPYENTNMLELFVFNPLADIEDEAHFSRHGF